MLAEADGGEPDVILIGTGSEVQIALAARETLQAGRDRRPGSFRCRAWNGSPSRRLPTGEEVLPARVRARVSVEAGIALGWRGYVGDAGECVSLEHFGASAAYQTLYEEFGITARAGGRGRPDQPGQAERQRRRLTQGAEVS